MTVRSVEVVTEDGTFFLDPDGDSFETVANAVARALEPNSHIRGNELFEGSFIFIPTRHIKYVLIHREEGDNE